jgi:aminoglycoside 6'-N-acetyltransferase I
MTTVAIRTVADDTELAAACRLLQSFFREGRFETPPETVAAHARRMHGLTDLCLILVGWLDDAAVAVATVSLDFGIEFGWQAEIGDLYVVPSARRQGLALRLVEASTAWARERGAQSVAITLTAHGADSGLEDFYRRLGFTSDGRRLLVRRLG